MSIYEYNEEYVRKVMHEDGYTQARVEAILELLAEYGEISKDLKERIEAEPKISTANAKASTMNILRLLFIL